VALFLSKYVNKVDQKGRVSVPAPFRAALTGQSFNGIVVYPSFRFEALDGRGADDMAEMVEKLDSEYNQFSDDYEALATIFAGSMQLAFDGEGRVVLPKSLMDFARITDNVAFVGIGKYFQLWDPAAYDAHHNAMRAHAVSNNLTLSPRRAEIAR